MQSAKGSARTPLGPIPKIVATFVYASSQGQRTHSARTKISILRSWDIEEPFVHPLVPFIISSNIRHSITKICWFQIIRWNLSWLGPVSQVRQGFLGQTSQSEWVYSKELKVVLKKIKFWPFWWKYCIFRPSSKPFKIRGIVFHQKAWTNYSNLHKCISTYPDLSGVFIFLFLYFCI